MSTERHADEQVLVGRIVRPHGLAGMVVVEMATDRPESRFAPGAVVFTPDGSPLTVERFERSDRSPLVGFEEVSGRDEADALRDTPLFIPPDQRRPLEEDEFWPEELIGMEVVGPDGISLGHVTDVEAGGGQDRLVVETEQGRITVPFVSEIVPQVDTGRRRLVVALPEGLTD